MNSTIKLILLIFHSLIPASGLSADNTSLAEIFDVNRLESGSRLLDSSNHQFQKELNFISNRGEIEKSIDSFLRPYIDTRSFSGVVFLAEGNKIIINRGYGMAVYEHSVKNSGDTKFQIGSLSKSFTAAAISLLVQNGQLGFDDHVKRFIPDFPGGDKITIAHLLTHRSGLPRYVFLPDYGQKSQNRHTTKDLVDWIAGKPRVSEPGKRFAYSNANYTLLAHIIERVSGNGYDEFLSKNIFKQLGLKNTGHRGNILAVVERMAFGYVPVGLNGLEKSRNYDYTTFTGAGSLYSSAEDLFLWYWARENRKLLSKEVTKDIAKRFGSSMGPGWNSEKRLNRDAIVMRGWDGVGFAAQLMHFPNEDRTVIVLSNLSMSSIADEIAGNVAAIAFGEKPKVLKLKSSQSKNSVALTDFAGRYKFGPDFYVPGTTIEFVVRDGQLLVPAQGPLPEGGLIPLSDGTFIHRQQWLRVRFKRDENGKVVGMRYGQFDVKKVK